MGNEVFANGNEIACKSGDGKVIAAFPDVCLSPPSPPAGPIPVPYPDTSFSKDMKNGSKTVKIDGKEVMLKDKSFYKTSPLGNEAATKSLGAGVVSHVITGKTYFVAWSMDVKFEGKNVDRHIDLTTSNHASPMGDTGTVTYLDKSAKKKCPPHLNLEITEKDIDKVIEDGEKKKDDLREKKKKFEDEKAAETTNAAKARKQIKINQCEKGIRKIDSGRPSLDWEKKVADDEKEKDPNVRTNIKVYCYDCKKTITQFDVLSSKVAKEAKMTSNGYKQDQHDIQKALVEEQKIFGEGIRVHIAVPNDQVDALLRDNPDLEKDRAQRGH